MQRKVSGAVPTGGGNYGSPSLTERSCEDDGFFKCPIDTAVGVQSFEVDYIDTDTEVLPCIVEAIPDELSRAAHERRLFQGTDEASPSIKDADADEAGFLIQRISDGCYIIMTITVWRKGGRLDDKVLGLARRRRGKANTIGLPRGTTTDSNTARPGSWVIGGACRGDAFERYACGVSEVCVMPGGAVTDGIEEGTIRAMQGNQATAIDQAQGRTMHRNQCRLAFSKVYLGKSMG